MNLENDIVVLGNFVEVLKSNAMVLEHLNGNIMILVNLVCWWVHFGFAGWPSWAFVLMFESYAMVLEAPRAEVLGSFVQEPAVESDGPRAPGK